MPPQRECSGALNNLASASALNSFIGKPPKQSIDDASNAALSAILPTVSKNSLEDSSKLDVSF